MQVVLDDEWEQHLRRAEKDEVGDRGRQQRSPEPDPALHEPEPLLERRHGRDLRRRPGPRHAPQREHADEADAERRGIDREGEPRAEGDERAAENGSEESQRDRPDQLVERVRRRQVGGRDELRDDRLEGGREERGADSIHGDQRNQLPEAQCTHEDEDCEPGNRRRAQDVRPHHHEPPVETVADDSADEQECDRRDRHADADDRERCRRVPE